MRPPEVPEVELRFAAKSAIRDRLVRVRRAVPKLARSERSERAVNHVMALPEWTTARTVATYAAMGGELDPAGLAAAAWASGKRVLLPRIDFATDELVLHEHREGDALEESGYGFFQPAAGRPVAIDGDVDFILIPAVAADERGYRIGYGRGYYDRLLPRLSKAFRVITVFDFQLLAEVPETPGDERAQVVATDGVVIRVGEP